MSNSCERLSGSHSAADFGRSGGVFALLSYVRRSLCRVRAPPRAVEPQGLLRSRAGSQPGVSGNKKGTSPLRRGAWLAILNASSRSFILLSLAGCSVFYSAPSARG